MKLTKAWKFFNTETPLPKNYEYYTEEEIVETMQKYADQQLLIHSVVGQSEQLACDCDRQPLRYNELGTCKYCGKQKPSEG